MAINYKNYHRDSEYLELESMYKNMFQKRVNLAKKFAKKGRVLDIGASNGGLLDLFKKEGWETWGVEPSQSSNLARKKGHKVIREFFEKASLPKNYFDLVIMNHTLEHLENPIRVLNKIHTLLKEKSVVFIDVPNAGGLAARVLGKRWPFLAPEEHLHQFTRMSLDKLLKDSGFRVVYFESRSGLFEFADPMLELYQALASLKKRFFRHILTFPYCLIVTLFNTGDSMSIVGKKK